MNLREQVFRKMGGWTYLEKSEFGPAQWTDGNNGYYELPPIDSSWEVCAKYLVPFMREKGYEYNIKSHSTHCNQKSFEWLELGTTEDMILCVTSAEIIDDKLPEAACKAFMEVNLD